MCNQFARLQKRKKREGFLLRKLDLDLTDLTGGPPVLKTNFTRELKKKKFGQLQKQIEKI